MIVTIAEIQNLVQMQLGLRKVSAEDRFMEDLGAESVDLLNIIAAVEDKYHISFDEAEIPGIRTVRQLYELTELTIRTGLHN